MFEKQQMKGLYFNQTPTKDVVLATVSMRPIPLGPIMVKLSLTPENYGTAKWYYVQTLDDHALSADVQEKLIRENSPEGVYKIKGSDHCPFFSKPQSLHKILLKIAQIPKLKSQKLLQRIFNVKKNKRTTETGHIVVESHCCTIDCGVKQ